MLRKTLFWLGLMLAPVASAAGVASLPDDNPAVAKPAAKQAGDKAEIEHLRQDVAREEADSRQADQRLQEQDRQIEALQRQLEALQAAGKATVKPPATR